MKILTVILFSFFSSQIWAQEGEDIQYVTGKLYLSLYQQADSGSDVLKSLVSGDRLDVLEIAGPYAKVITEQGKEGWVKKGFLVKAKPASILYRETDATLKLLQEKVAIDKEQNGSFEEIKSELEILQSENKELKQIKEIYLKQKELKDAENESDGPFVKDQSAGKIDLDVFKAFMQEYSFFILAAFLLLVLIGYRIGELKKESEVIKHFGGVKVW